MTPADPTLARTLTDIDRATDGMSRDALVWQRDRHWSSAAILDHLAKTYATTAYILRKGVTDGAPKGRPASMRQRIFTFAITRLGWFPTGIKSPVVAEPEGLGPEEALAAARRELLAFDAAACECRQRFGARALVANHPMLGGFTVDQWRRFHAVHTRHHTRQIVRLRAAWEAHARRSTDSV